MLHKIGYNTFFLGLFTLAVSIPVSKFGTSLGTILMVLGWLLPFNWKEKAQQLKKNGKSLLIGIGIFLIFATGLIYTEDYGFGLKDVKVKLPLLVLPVVFVTGFRPSQKQIITTLTLLSLSGVAASIIGFIQFQFITTPIKDLRILSPFISHIRLSLVLVFGFGFGAWLIYRLKHPSKWFVLILLAWIVFFISYSESLTGIALLPIISIWFLFLSLRKNKKAATILTSSGIAIALFCTYELYKIYNLVFTQPSIEISEKTLSGNMYQNYSGNLETENGNYVYRFICDKELAPKWDEISTLDYNTTKNGYPFKIIIYRYLTSKGLKKDSTSLSQLSNREIAAIEQGTTNWFYVDRNSISKRVHQSFWEIKNAFETKSFKGKSIALRLIYWEIGWELFQKNWLTGVGTGDTKMAFDKAYQQKSLDWSNKYKRRSHQQFLTTAVALGIIGFLIFVYCLIAMWKNYTGTLPWLYSLVFIILMVSFLWEDTLETQAGVSIFAILIYTLFYQDQNITALD